MKGIPGELSEQSVVVLPLTRLVFDMPFRVGPFFFFPPGEFNIQSLHPLPLLDVEDYTNAHGNIHLAGQSLRRVPVAITGFSTEVLDLNPLVVFTDDIDWQRFQRLDHDGDVEIIKALSSKAEKALDIIRFDYCRFALADTLPGLAGSWEGSGQYLGALLYDPTTNQGHLLAGAGVESTVLIRGLGLEVNGSPCSTFPDPGSGGVAALASHALSLFSDVMNASNETIKFVRAMTLLEFLGSPDEFKKWKELKGEIICHCAKDKADYHRLAERMKELTSKEDEQGVQSGLRTLIVHHGKFLPGLIPDRQKRKDLFNELQMYAERVLTDMLDHRTMSWEEFCAYRITLKAGLGAI